MNPLANRNVEKIHETREERPERQAKAGGIYSLLIANMSEKRSRPGK